MNNKVLPPGDSLFDCLAAANKTQETSKIPANIFGRFREWILCKSYSIVCAAKGSDYYGKAQS